ncbi:E3 ubiquitin-protein ligase RHA2B-like [Hermetia illucens]|uniref:E3 ubiquitin-protein ligase RHA2B-like n=1 Tax=Hermetia illucens TaxID=343691 RepID=UPI0018CC1BCD|nr:E3 ubiquitin-protein ligase RHA2B-like [Hermetia illucens]XP_037923114.1 E3 ubiquitin-protein ligase RHA2B-like [Hermetia illucens]XP_037923115.1 E3 ubiquitin-protein ligase RHA2B-like [Hermetia illucens]
MTHPAVYLISIGVAVGVALFAFFANAPQYNRTGQHRSHRTFDFEYVDNSRECTICISNITSDLTYLDCGHAFHRRCIRKWLNTSDTCPNCKQIQRNQI